MSTIFFFGRDVFMIGLALDRGRRALFCKPGFESSGTRVYLDCLMQTRDDAWNLLCEYTKGESLRKHALAVEAVMRAYARNLGEDEDEWGLVGMLHDFDYEMYPNPPDHPMKGSEILREHGYSEDIRRAILGHANYTGVARDTLLARGLYACDELTGFVVACALVRPNGIWDLESKSVKKKLKDKAFARTVNRDEVYEGAEELAVDLGEHIDFIIGSLREVAAEVGLKLRADEVSQDNQQQESRE
jgi:putative nucleotidyltransferase with HDIG domain